MSFKIENISDAYAIIEIYDYGSIEQNLYLKACAYMLEYYREKYGKNDFRFKELFSLMQSENSWEFTHEIRSLIHTEVINCFHSIISECDKHKTLFEREILKAKKCQHCRYLEGIKEKWDNK